jgi:hypothetical protein
MNLAERAELEEAISGGPVYLVVTRPGGGVGITRVHPDGGISAISYGAELAQASSITEALNHFRSGSSHEGEW